MGRSPPSLRSHYRAKKKMLSLHITSIGEDEQKRLEKRDPKHQSKQEHPPQNQHARREARGETHNNILGNEWRR